MKNNHKRILMMKNNYRRTHQITAYLVLLGLFLQSCGTFSNQLIPRAAEANEKEQVHSSIQHQERSSLVDQKSLVAHEFTAEKGYLVTFHEQDGKLAADVKIDASQAEPNYTHVPVIVVKDTRLTALRHVDKAIQKRCIQVERTSIGRPNRVVVTRGGLKGGMLEGDTKTSSTSPNSRTVKLTEVRELRDYFSKRTLEITPRNGQDLLRASESYADSFMSYDGMLFVKNWSNTDDLVTLAGILQSFGKVSKLKAIFLGEDVVGLAKTIARGLQFYEGLVELDVSGCQLTDGLLEEMMESVHLTSLKTINIANNNITSEFIFDLEAAFPEVSFITQAPTSGSIRSRFTARSASGNRVSGGNSIAGNSPERSPQSSPNNSVSARDHSISRKVEEKEEVVPFYTSSEELTAYERMGFNKFLPAIAKGSIEYGIQLGRGGMGAVFQGKYQGKVVAVKRLLRLSEEEIAAFQKEAMIMSNYRHRNLISFLGYCPEEYAFMMEYASGGSLWSLLKSSEAISWEKRYEIGLDVAKGMDYLHDNGVVHCDLKSDNILLDHSRRAKITDFGISALRREHVSSGKSTYGEWGGGTYCWMAPEIFHTNKNTKAGDVYAYGLVLWQLGARKIPFSGIEGLLPYISAGNKEVITTDTPPLIKQAIELCWLPEPPLKKATDTKNRPSMQEVRLLLEKWNEKEEQELREKAAKELAEKEMLRNELAELKKALKSAGEGSLKEKEKEKEKGNEDEKEQAIPQVRGNNQRHNQPTKVREENAREPEINISELEAKILTFPQGNEILDQLKRPKAGETIDLTVNYYRVLNTDQCRIVFQHPCFKQVTLKLSNIGAEGFSKLAQALPATQIHTLDLRFNNIGAEEATKLAQALPATQIHTLDLSNTDIVAEGAIKLAQALPATKIHTLDLSCNKIGAEGATKLAAALPATQIHTLNLGSDNIGAEGATKLAQALPATKIHTLKLSGNQIGDEGTIKLAQVLPATKIHTLDLSYNNIGAEGAIKLAAALPNTQIHTLYLSSNNISAEGAIKLAQALPATKIHTLNLQINQIGDEGATKLAAALPATQIHTFGLSYNNIGAEGAIKLAAALPATKIHTLDLRYNNIGAEGATKLAAVLPATQIHTLNLESNNIGAEGATKLAAVLPATQIHTLNLQINQIGDEGATKLAAALPATQIHTFDLRHNQIGAEGAIKLAAALPATQIHTLKLEHNQIGDEGATKLAQVLLPSTQIHTLDLYGNKIGYETESLLKKKFPKIYFGF